MVTNYYRALYGGHKIITELCTATSTNSDTKMKLLKDISGAKEVTVDFKT